MTTIMKELTLYKPKPVTTEQARKIGESIGVDFDKYDLEQFRMGLEVEQEHGEHDASTGVTEGSWKVVGQIAWAHVKEIDDYYTRLKQMEESAKKDTEIKKEHACSCGKFWGACSGCPTDVCKTHERREAFGHIELIKADDGFYIAGYASPWVVDDEGHRIEREALRPAFAKFMENPKYANVMVVHTGIQVGEVVQSVRDSKGKLWKSGVDKKGLFVICRLRDDIMVGKEVIDAIKKGELNSFSIRGRGLERQFVCENGRSFWSIPKLELYEITVCRRGVNPEAKFVIVKSKDPIHLNFSCNTDEEFRKAIEGMDLGALPLTVPVDLLKSVQDSMSKPIMISKGFVSLLGASDAGVDIMIKKQKVDEPFDLTYKLGILKTMPNLVSQVHWMGDASDVLQGAPMYDLWLVPTKGMSKVVASASDIKLMRSLEVRHEENR